VERVPAQLGESFSVYLAKFWDFARFGPYRVSGSSETKTYGKDVAMREHAEL